MIYRAFLWLVFPFYALALCSVALAAAPLRHDAYIWQRAWTEPVQEAVTEHGTNFTSLVALGAEISWLKGEPRVTPAAVDYPTLQAQKRPVGLALRIGPYSGPFRTNDAVAKTIVGAARALLASTASNHVAVSELQIDFDSAESKLDGYALWVEALRRQLGSTKLVVTALPSWLRQKAFTNLVSRCDGYVLQVHSLERPRSYNDSFTLCDPAAARAAVAQAARLSFPFRVALPTYGYFVGFDENDRFIGLAADGPAIQWPAGARIKHVSADPIEMAKLVAFWSTNRPSHMHGVIWYRLPISTDILNWRFSTLGVVMACRVPQADLKVESRFLEPDLAEIFLRNAGSADFPGAASIRVLIRNGHLIASDAVGGFHLQRTGSHSWTFHSAQPFLRAGDERRIGWLRLSRKAEVELEILQ